VAETRVACGFDIRSATWSSGIIFTLPGDRIGTIAEPVAQQAEIPAAKERLRARFPIFRLYELDQRATAAELRAALVAAGVQA
jgi:hypothetical protein